MLLALLEWNRAPLELLILLFSNKDESQRSQGRSLRLACSSWIAISPISGAA